jgi:isocitrate/isopropylmalate dehydrogenase
MDVSVFTKTGVRRIMKFAFELARKRPKKHLTLVTKSNAQRHGMVMWDEILMLEHLGEKQISAKLMKAIETLTASGETLPKDLGGSGTTTQVADAVCDAIRKTYEKA